MLIGDPVFLIFLVPHITYLIHLFSISLIFQYLVSRCLEPQTPPEKAFRGSKHLLRRYLEDFGQDILTLKVVATILITVVPFVS